ncbi:MAG TPA: histidine kinase [Longimicrobium sp.]
MSRRRAGPAPPDTPTVAGAFRRRGVWAALALLWAALMAGHVALMLTILPPGDPEWPVGLAAAAWDELGWMAAYAAAIAVAFRVPLRRDTLGRVVLGALAVLGARQLALLAITLVFPVWRYVPLMQLAVFPSTVPGAVAAVAAGYALKAALRLDGDERRLARLRAEVADQELRSVRAGVNPRLLLRALRRIADTARMDPHRADAAVCRLGDYLRLALHGRPGDPVSVDEEVECMRACAAVEGACRAEGVDFNAALPCALRRAPVHRRELQAPLERLLARHADRPGRLAVDLAGWAREGRPWFRIAVRPARDGASAGDEMAIPAGWSGGEAAAPQPPAAPWTEEIPRPTARLAAAYLLAWVALAAVGMAARWLLARYAPEWVGGQPFSLRAAAASAAILDVPAMLLAPSAVWAGGRVRLRERPGRGAAALLLAGALLMIAAGAVRIALRHWLLPRPPPFSVIFWEGATTYLPLYAGCAAFGQAVVYFRAVGEAATRALRLRTQLRGAQLRALKGQLHPHFLFNALNSVSALLQQDADDAVDVLRRLSRLLRRTLRRSDAQLVTLREELGFLARYLAIERVRYRERLRVRIAVAPAAREALVPHLVLQPLVENAIRHGLGPTRRPVTLTIRARLAGDGALCVEVRDTGAGLPAGWTRARAGIGLRNTAARLRQHYGAGASLRITSPEGGGVRVRLRIPQLAGVPAG